MFDSLVFSPHFIDLLAFEVEKVLGTKVLKVGEQFDSTDSYAFLIEMTDGSSYVGKIFRFPDWPPEGKLEAISSILFQNNIAHEETVFITHQHAVFTYGWQISRYISGGTARDLLSKGSINKEEYFESIGKILSETHDIKSPVCGSILDHEDQFSSFKDMVEDELADQSFESLSSEYAKQKEVLEESKKTILDLVSQANFNNFSLVHDDAGAKNVLWNNGNPIMIDWVDAVWAPPLRDFAPLTYGENESVLFYIEKGYGKEINKEELFLHQLMRLVRLARFYFFVSKKTDEFDLRVTRASTLLRDRKPFGI